MYGFVRPLLFAFDPERANGLTMAGLEISKKLGLIRLIATPPKPLLTKAFGISFPNPVGLAAGLDKDGVHIDALAELGFGFIEIGSVTPRGQPGNVRPRVFRLSKHQAIINRMGFNSAGVDAVVSNVERASYRGVLGINIGKNRETMSKNAIDDFIYCLERVYALASYVTVNVSSPNTRGLRDLQQEEQLKRFVGRLREVQETLAAKHGKHTPILLKIAPDLFDAEIDGIASVLSSVGIDGVVATNTTVDRNKVQGHAQAQQEGGLSGRPLYSHSTYVLRRLRAHLPGSIPIIGVGGVLSGADAAGKIAAGATLVQMFTGLIYRGPNLVRECVDAIRRRREAPSSTG